MVNDQKWSSPHFFSVSSNNCYLMVKFQLFQGREAATNVALELAPDPLQPKNGLCQSGSGSKAAQQSVGVIFKRLQTLQRDCFFAYSYIN